MSTEFYRPAPGHPSKNGANIAAERSRPLCPGAVAIVGKGDIFLARRSIRGAIGVWVKEADTVCDLCWQRPDRSR